MADTIFYYSDGTTSTSSDTILTLSSRNTLKSLIKVDIGSSVITLGTNCFDSGFNTSLESVVIPDNVLNIQSFAFGFDTTLKNIWIGKGITTIVNYAFIYVVNLKNMYFSGNAPIFEANCFEGSNTNFKIYKKKNFVTGWFSSVQGRPVVLWSDNVIKSGGTGKLTTKKRN